MYAFFQNSTLMFKTWSSLAAIGLVLFLVQFDFQTLDYTFFGAVAIASGAMLVTGSYRYALWNVRLAALIGFFVLVSFLNYALIGGRMFPDHLFYTLMFLILAGLGLAARGLQMATGSTVQKASILKEAKGVVAATGSYQDFNDERQYAFVDIRDENGGITRIEKVRVNLSQDSFFAAGTKIDISVMTHRFLFGKMNTVVLIESGGRTHIPKQKNFATNIATAAVMLLATVIIVGFFTVICYIPLLSMALVVVALWFTTSYTLYRLALSSFASHAKRSGVGPGTHIVRTV